MSHPTTLPTTTVGRIKTTPNVLAFMGIQACIEPFEMQRFTQLANTWHQPITVCDAPGWGHGGNRLTSMQRRQLRHGTFDAVAQAMVRAARTTRPSLADEPVTLLGYSMGASLAAAAAAAADLAVDTMILIEPVGLHAWSPLKLLRNVTREDQYTDTYLRRNPAEAVQPWDRRGEPTPPHSWLDLAHLGWAISRGRLPSDLLRAHARRPLKHLHLVRADSSSLCTEEGIRRLTQTAAGANIATTVHTIPGHHQVWQSVPDVLALGTQLAA